MVKGDKKQLKEICERTLAFENHFLDLYKDFMLSELTNGLSLTEAVEHFGISEELLRERIEKGEIET